MLKVPLIGDMIYIYILTQLAIDTTSISLIYCQFTRTNRHRSKVTSFREVNCVCIARFMAYESCKKHWMATCLPLGEKKLANIQPSLSWRFAVDKYYRYYKYKHMYIYIYRSSIALVFGWPLGSMVRLFTFNLY